MSEIVPLHSLQQHTQMLTYVIGGSSEGKSQQTCHRLDVSTGSWEALPPMEHCRSGAAAAALRGCIYVCGGMRGSHVLRSVETFSPATHRWHGACDMQEKRQGAAAAVAGDSLFVCGGGNGYNMISSVERYDPGRNSWHAVSSMRHQRLHCAAAALKTTVYVCGGSKGSETLASVEALSAEDASSTSSWQVAPPMLSARKRFGAVGFYGHVYVIGGKDATQVLQTVERFDPKTSLWERLQDFSVPLQGLVAAPASGGRLLVCGGSRGAEKDEFRETFVFELLTKSWQPSLPLPEPLDGAVAVSLTPCWMHKGTELPLNASSSIHSL
eukprot:TRINITY_DN28159_c0_g1_i1.p1 TRINITY_DN28159_c0_g1~~TRINITY_DN28159_c0_g1_i1.p1  ORF type:complete len:326 (-),score=34.78 TRINITY_DN28159_c0_g1_i1:322-1299(-)